MKRMLLALAFLSGTTAAVVLIPDEALALPCCDAFYEFYSDCSYTQVVGAVERNCMGTLIQNWGTRNYNGPYYYQANDCGNEACCSEEFGCYCVGSGYNTNACP
jgi:hypothetical protein